MTNKTHKIIVVGLPKTGTSTLTVMLRILGYHVTGPDVHYTYGDIDGLKKQFESYNGFQDYPWCFEWERFINDERVLFIELTRDKEAWWQSFYESYGGKGTSYLSYPYFGLQKQLDQKSHFINYFEGYYSNFRAFKTLYPDRVLSRHVKDLDWKDLCGFLNEPLPRTFFNTLVKKPHVNKHHSKQRTSFKYKTLNYIRAVLLPVLGPVLWLKITVYLRKQGFIKR
ncbi:hypothetical protein LRR18_06450 [Mangrovimonas sp. AS39]|uniref:sulfotransferase n=1 Tax=Mangrovimonas futianensis TaxID=2895523 RepID=UPI001E549215|nr:sulfotransferase [Mangrovimonas futianensis]MCF1191222.1 hypothetical protein [Mangrovimonas futianensis]MCF1194917.1 hypothetical protein [Mangrovimonas futianensis]